MIRAVYDTNILISAFIGKGPPYKVLSAVYDGKVRLIISPEIFDEFKNVIPRKKFGFTKQQIEKMSSIILQVSEFIQPKEKINLIKIDPKDNIILECAKASNVKYIVSGDPHLLKLEKWNDIEIISAKKFLKILEE
jgi:putative PIN family toxin of toxin-antitoxin system